MTIDTEFEIQLQEKARFVNDTLRKLLEQQEHNIEEQLKQAIRYTLESPGKRIRPALLFWCCELVSGQINRNAQMAAASIEMVHTYSLIHDDLPAMDNDDLRRGKPTCHKAFDEATAILTGDALLTMAFETLASQIDKPALAVKLIGKLAEASGPAGMIAGQMADLKAEKTDNTEKLLEYIHLNKTAKMFRCAAEMGAMTANAGLQEQKNLSEYGLKIGLAFQIADDILDICSSSEHIGKTAGKDKKASKCTYPAVMGLEKSREIEKHIVSQAIAALEPFSQKADILRKLASALLQRTR